MAAMGSLVANVVANTRQFDTAISRSQQALQQFGRGAQKAAEAAHAIDSLGMSGNLQNELIIVTKQMGDLQTATAIAAQQAARFEHAAHLVAAGASTAATGVSAFASSTSLISNAAGSASHGMHTVLIGAIAVRRTLESLSWAFGVVADGARVLLVPIRAMVSAFKLLAYPLKLVASAVLSVAQGLFAVLRPVISLAGGVFNLWVQFKAFQLQVKLMRALLEMLPPKVRAVATALFGLGLASRAVTAGLSSMGAAGRMLGSVLSFLATPIRALLSPMRTLEAVFKRTGSVISGFVSSALTPLKIALSGLGAVAAVGGMLKLAADAQTLQMQMEVLTKDTKVAADLIADLNAFSNIAPFDKMDLKQAATQLLAARTPAKEIVNDLTVLSNIAAGTGSSITELTDIFAGFRNQQVLYNGDLDQLQRRGINVFTQLQAKFGDVQKAASDGRVTFDDVRQALYEMTTGTGDFAGMISKLSGSLAGQFSAFKNNITILATAIGTELLPHAQKLLEWANGLFRSFQQLQDKTGFLRDVLVAGWDVVTLTIIEKWDEMLNEMARMAYAKGNEISKFLKAIMSPVGMAKAIGEMAAGAAGGMPAGNARAQSLQQAQTRLETLLQKLATAPAPLAEPQLPVPQMAGKQGGMVLANAIGDMISEMKGNAAPIVAGVNQMLADAQLKGFLALTAISSAFDGRGSEGQQKQQARQTATALQRGSAEAYSAIVQAMSGAKDPVVKAVDKQTKALGEPLKQMADVLIKAKPLEVIGNLFGGE
jgi:hypothetical protein